MVQYRYLSAYPSGDKVPPVFEGEEIVPFSQDGPFEIFGDGKNGGCDTLKRILITIDRVVVYSWTKLYVIRKLIENNSYLCKSFGY